jgi:protein-S-isoprenylcysteine O-methyltransferase Ste14
MLLRALFAFLVLPGVVALLIPAIIGVRELNAGGEFAAAGLLPLTGGFALLSWCIRDFYVSGKGTLAPWSPPRHLVTVGPYRYSRWAVCFWSPTLAIYTGSVMVGFHLRVVFGEEPWLARTHGAAWDEYESKVPRWLLWVDKSASLRRAAQLPARGESNVQEDPGGHRGRVELRCARRAQG